MKKIKVLQFPIANSFGGITHYALNNWKWIDKERFQVDFATMSKKLDFDKEILETGSKIHYISCYAEQDREKFVLEFEQILKNGYDVVHLHTKQWKSFVAEELCVKYNVPKIIVHSHSTGVDTLDPVLRLKEEQMHETIKSSFNRSLATDFWACSQQAAEFLFGNCIPSDEIRIMKNAIEVDKFKYNQERRDDYRKKYKLEKDYVIGSVGRFVYQKNHEFLFKVFFETAKIIPNVKLLLIGDGELLPEMKKKAMESGVGDKIIFLGKRQDVENWYQVMDIFCLPSRFEGLGIAFIEAQAAGLPCIGSDCVPSEVRMSDNMHLIPFEIKLWIDLILSYAGVNKRYDIKRIEEKGYDIRKQIRCVEEGYMENAFNIPEGKG